MRRERPWVLLGGSILAAVAGYVNLCLLSFFHVPVSHMSGAVSRLSLDAAAMNVTDLRLVVSIVGAFLAGAALSGLIIGGTSFLPGRRYGVTLMVEGVVLALATWLLLRGEAAGVAVAALACGVQNAMASSYYGLIVRTTHVTGIVTDLGVMIGHWMRHRRVQPWKLLLLVSILVGFGAGGTLGALAVRSLGMAALGITAGGCFAAGAVYFGWRHRMRPPNAPPRDADR